MEIKYRKYLNINEKALTEVKKIIRSGYFKKNFKNKFESLKKLNTRLSKIYEVPRSKIKIVPYYVANKSHDKTYILIGDALSLVSFLAKFKKNLDIYNKNNEQKEVILKRDCFDWALSIVQTSMPEIMDKIFETKENIIEKKKEKEDKEKEKEIIKKLIYSIEIKKEVKQ